ncbi:hypothetical protein EMIT0194P_10113 [Pseudomonas serbica]
MLINQQPFPQENTIKNRSLDWLFFNLPTAGHGLQGLQRGANMLSTETLTGIVGNPLSASPSWNSGDKCSSAKRTSCVSNRVSRLV